MSSRQKCGTGGIVFNEFESVMRTMLVAEFRHLYCLHANNLFNFGICHELDEENIVGLR